MIEQGRTLRLSGAPDTTTEEWHRDQARAKHDAAETVEDRAFWLAQIIHWMEAIVAKRHDIY